MKQIIINFDPDGTASTIYNENLSLEELGKIKEIKRASHVEPTENGQWTADMTPVGGPILGPFDLRSVALKEEVKWLEKNYFGYEGNIIE